MQREAQRCMHQGQDIVFCEMRMKGEEGESERKQRREC